MEHPEIKLAALRQDNAGYYHSVTMLSAHRLTGKATGIHVRRVETVTFMETKALATGKPLPSRLTCDNGLTRTTMC